ncbi:hypothetical protein [Aestuariimicrobium ganziense]|uniref:hypothetical protein n=1 Tax=Aestuariimicrobium ganziense TaxID=2773677 RepID=UPI001941088A|nr:hypothetical protein [Aestuariimicrobium ganziense]
MDPLIVDCGTCEMRDLACSDCLMTALLGGPPVSAHEFSGEEAGAMGALAMGGLLPPLRLVERLEPVFDDRGDDLGSQAM